MSTSSQWTSVPYAAALAVFLVAYFIIYPLFQYIRDPKGELLRCLCVKSNVVAENRVGLRRFPNFNALSGVSNLPFMILAHGGARSAYLSKLYKKRPILRTGPNTLSFGSVLAIKEIYGHGAPCLKDESYDLTSGTHYHLADVIDKGEHARKHKVLSSTYDLNNLENWEHKVADKVERLIAQLDK